MWMLHVDSPLGGLVGCWVRFPLLSPTPNVIKLVWWWDITCLLRCNFVCKISVYFATVLRFSCIFWLQPIGPLCAVEYAHGWDCRKKRLQSFSQGYWPLVWWCLNYQIYSEFQHPKACVEEKDRNIIFWVYVYSNSHQTLLFAVPTWFVYDNLWIT